VKSFGTEYHRSTSAGHLPRRVGFQVFQYRQDADLSVLTTKISHASHTSFTQLRYDLLGLTVFFLELVGIQPEHGLDPSEVLVKLVLALTEGA